jgi:hypothetical protein
MLHAACMRPGSKIDQGHGEPPGREYVAGALQQAAVSKPKESFGDLLGVQESATHPESRMRDRRQAKGQGARVIKVLRPECREGVEPAV